MGEEEAIELDHLSESSLALANQLSIEQALPADVVSLESEPWFELERPFADVPLNTEASPSLPSPFSPASESSIQTESTPSSAAESFAVEPPSVAAEPESTGHSASSTTDGEPSVELVLTTPVSPRTPEDALQPSPSLFARAPEGALRPRSHTDEPRTSTRAPKRVPPPPPVSRSPHSSSTQLPPTQFGRASTATHPPVSHTPGGSRADILRPRADSSRASSQVGLTGSHAALSLESPTPDASAPRTRTGSRPKVVLAHLEESAPPEKPTPTLRARLNSSLARAGAPHNSSLARAGAPHNSSLARAGAPLDSPPPPARPEANETTPTAPADEKRTPTLRSSSNRPPSTSVSVPPAGPPRTTLPGDRWYVLTPRGQVGPYKADEFASRLETGEVSWDMLIWRKGLRDWKPGRRDDLLVIAVAGTLGLGNKTTPLEGLSALMRSSIAADAPRAPSGPSEWLVDEEDTRMESWPLGMQLRPDLPLLSPSVQQPLPAQGSSHTLSAQRSMPPQLSLSQQRALPPQPSRAPQQQPVSQHGSLSSQHALPGQPSISLQQALSTSVPGSPTQRVRVPGTHPPPPLSTRNTSSQAAGARDIPTGRFPRSSANSPEIKRGRRGTFIAILAFAAGAAVALSSGRILELSRVVLREPLAQVDAPSNESSSATQQLAAMLRPLIDEPPSATLHSMAEGPRAAKAEQAEESSAGASSLDTPVGTSPAAVPAPSGNLEIVTRSLPAPEEVRDELKRLSPSLSRCVRSPAAGLDVELTVDGVTGSVSKVDVHAPELTPGRLECLKEGFSDLHVAPFVSEQLKYRHRFAW